MIAVKFFIKDEFHKYLDIGTPVWMKEEDFKKYINWISRNRLRLHLKDDK